MNRFPGIAAVSLVVVGFVAGLAFEPSRLTNLVPRADAAEAPEVARAAARASVGAAATSSAPAPPAAKRQRVAPAIDVERTEPDELRVSEASRASRASRASQSARLAIRGTAKPAPDVDLDNLFERALSPR